MHSLFIDFRDIIWFYKLRMFKKKLLFCGIKFKFETFFAIMWLQKSLENRALKLISKLSKYIHRWKIRQNDVEGLLNYKVFCVVYCWK